MDEISLLGLAETVRAATADHARLRHLTTQLETTMALVATRQDDLAELQRALQVEQSDVRRLEQLSPTKIWATLRGNTADRLAIERAEEDAAALAVAAGQARLADATADHTRVRDEHQSLSGADRAHVEALAAYEAALLAAGHPDGRELAELAGHLGSAEEQQREVAEAVDALRVARTALKTALTKLESAGGWATYDTFLGGGLVADMVKHSKIDDATKAFQDVNRALERLSVELADIGATAVDGVEISEMLAVFDVLFDNIISDWMVRDRISEARTSAKQLEGRLSRLDGELGTSAREVSSRVAALRQRREEILAAV